MANLRPHFNALLGKINPTEDRRRLARMLPGEVLDRLDKSKKYGKTTR